jgi:ADP-heptose:LPS heptosyltransferase
VAAAVGTHAVALFGATDPHRTYPVGPPGRHVIMASKRIATVAHWHRGRVRPEAAGAGAAEIPVAPVLDATMHFLFGVRTA